MRARTVPPVRRRVAPASTFSVMTQRWAPGTGRTPGGVPGAWFNVVVCAIIGIGGLGVAATHGFRGEWLFVGIALPLICVYMEFVFVRNVRRQRERVRRSRE